MPICGILAGVGTLSIQEHVALAPFTTIAVGGAARFLAHVTSEKELEEAIAFREHQKLPLAILGGGSNTLVREEGFPGLVVHLDIRGELQITGDNGLVRCDVPAGMPWEDFVLQVCTLDLSGVECLAGIPGMTGGTPVQNVGAYGQEVSQAIRAVRVYDLFSRAFIQLTREDCHFAYRSSIFNTHQLGRYIVTAVTFDLRKDVSPQLTYAELQNRFEKDTPTPLQVYEAVREIRGAKGMLLLAEDPDSRSVGSFFKNPIVPESQLTEIESIAGGGGTKIPSWPLPPLDSRLSCVKLSAAWLVERAGFPRGFVDGRAGISSRHSLALINRGGATFADIARLRDRIRAGVAAKFALNLEQEPVELGSDTARASLPHRL